MKKNKEFDVWSDTGSFMFSADKKEVRKYLLDGGAWASGDIIRADVIIIGEDGRRPELTEFVTLEDFHSPAEWDRMAHEMIKARESVLIKYPKQEEE